MGDTSLAKLSGIFALLSAAFILIAMSMGIDWAGRGPAAMRFGDPASLEVLAGGRAVLLDSLALVGPLLALGAGLGWWPLLRSGRTYAALGILLWYLGMIFVIWQDALELVFAAHLTAGHLAADPAGEAALLAAGALLGEAVGAVLPLGDFIGLFGLLLIGLAFWEKGGQWRLLGGMAALSAVAVALGLAIPAVAPLRLLGSVLFMAWMIAMGVVMLRWRPGSALA